MTSLLKNVRIISPGVDIPGGAVLCDGAKINRICLAGEDLPAADCVIDGGGAWAVPGFFDIHTHGCGGADFCGAGADEIAAVAEHKLSQGVTSFLGTTLTLPEEQLSVSLRRAADYVASGARGAKIPGIHLEGPFFVAECAGAQNPAFLQRPDIGLVERLDRIFPVKKVSYSLELDPDAVFCRELVARGIMPAAAHTGAPYEVFKRAYDCGLRHLSHFCNVMTPLHHLRFGIVGGGLLHKGVFLELICDGVHLCPEMIQLIFAVKGCERIMLITDSMMAGGMPDGDYTLGGLPVIVKDGCARLSSGAVAGSTLLYFNGLKRVRDLTGLPLSELIGTTSWNQAQSLGIEGIGKLECGYAADIAVLEPETFRPLQTFVNGELRWQSK